jgi:sporulation protein YlmC with PRC-barrel domain
MKWKFQIIISAFAVSFMAIPAFAQNTSNPKLAGADDQHDGLVHTQRPDQPDGTVKTSDLIGMAVNNCQHERLGIVQDFVLDVESGRIVQVILSTGGILHMGTALTAVPPEVLRHEAGCKVLYLDASKEKFGMAPRFDSSKWIEEMQSNRLAEVCEFYGQQPYFITDNDGYWTNIVYGTLTTKYPLNMDGSINTSGARAADTAHKVAESKNAILTRIPDGTWTEGHAWIENATNSLWSSLGYVEQASKFIGTPVENLQGGKLGGVANLMVNLSSGRIVAVIISTGGYVGIGVELRAVPPAALRFNAQHDTLQLDTPDEVFASSSHFDANH